MSGGIDVLNTGAGHLEIRFKEGDAIEIERAKRIVQDMLRRGYALFIDEGGTMVRVKRFDPTQCCYIIADGPTDPASTEPDKPKARKKERALPMASTRVTAVGRSAGG